MWNSSWLSVSLTEFGEMKFELLGKLMFFLEKLIFPMRNLEVKIATFTLPSTEINALLLSIN